MNDIDSIRFINSLKKLTAQPRRNNMIVGEIVNVEPLKIDIGNNIVLTKKFLYLGQMCRPHTVTIPHTHIYNGYTEDAKAVSASILEATQPHGGANITTTGQATTVVTEAFGHRHEIKNQETEDVHKEGCGTDYEDSVTLEIYPKLKKGDKVLMFVMNEGQLYYVAERIEG